MCETMKTECGLLDILREIAGFDFLFGSIPSLVIEVGSLPDRQRRYPRTFVESDRLYLKETAHVVR